jgi:Icc-related predicted phosphoesterase
MDDFAGDADVVVLAGDILPLKYVDQVRNVFAPFCERYKHVIFVPGNHEYYGTNVRDAHLILGAVQNELYNLNVLKNSAIVLDGQKFYGGSLWFPELPKGLEHLKEMLNDFFEIGGIEPFCYSNYREFRQQAIKHLDKNCVVVSHHLPTWESVAIKYTASPLNRFFVGDCEDLIKAFQPKLWIHGHTHDSCDFMGQRFPPREGDIPPLGNTRIVCNPFGYNGFNESYIRNLYIDV